MVGALRLHRLHGSPPAEGSPGKKRKGPPCSLARVGGSLLRHGHGGGDPRPDCYAARGFHFLAAARVSGVIIK